MMNASTPPAPGQNPDERLREMERQLKDKESQLRDRDRMVQELTQRLSQTVEKLDRVQRVGSDRAVISTTAFPKEIVEQQSELVEDLARAVQLWENMQVGCGLGRVEMQVSDLRELFEERFLEEDPEAEADETPAEAETAGGNASESESADASDLEPSAEGMMAWPTSLEALEAMTEGEEDFLLHDDMTPLRPPEILNLDEASEKDLKRCVEQQDTYIDYLSSRLKRVAEKQPAVNWDDLADKPDKLQLYMERTASKLQQSRHFAEFELALQRTRLKRKERELKKLSDGLAHSMQSNDHHPPEHDHGKDPNGRRWMRMLGMGKPEE